MASMNKDFFYKRNDLPIIVISHKSKIIEESPHKWPKKYYSLEAQHHFISYMLFIGVKHM